MNLKELKRLTERRLEVERLDKGGRIVDDVYARFVFMKAAYTSLKYNVTDIGRALNRHHATVLNGIKQFDMLYDNRDFKKYKREYLIITSAIEMYEEKNAHLLHIHAANIDSLEQKYSRKLAEEVFKMQEEIMEIKGLMFDEVFDEINELSDKDKEEFKSLAKVFLKRKKRELEHS